MRRRAAALALAVALGAAAGCGGRRGVAGAGDAGPAVVLVETPDGGGAPGAPVGETVDEHEPNDDVRAAQPLALGGEAAVRVRATLGPPRGRRADLDLYRIEVPAGERRQVRIEVAPGPDVDLALELLDAAGERILALNDGKEGEPELCPAVALAGPAFVRVREGAPKAGAPARAPAGPRGYTLKVAAVPVGAGEELEPDDKAAYAQELAPGGEVAGYVGWLKDVDYYKVPLAGAPEGGTLRVDLDGVDGVAATLQVVDSIEAPLGEARGGKGEALTLRNVGIRAGEPCYYVVVRGDWTKNAEARYALRVAAEAPIGPQELEPNDQPEHATPAPEAGAVTGFVGLGDVDLFRLALPGRRVVRAEVSSPDRVDVKLGVVDPAGRARVTVDGGGRREPEILPALVAEGELLLKVWARPRDANPDEPYRLSWTVAPDDGRTEREPDDDAAHATPLGGDAAEGRGFIHPRADEDWWRLDPSGGATVIATLDGVPKALLDLYLFDDARVKLAEARGVRPEGVRRLEATLTPGRACFLVVKERSGKESNPRDAYVLHVERR